MNRPIVVAISGSSGATYGQRLVQVLLDSNQEVILTISSAAAQVIRHELGREIDLQEFSADQFLPADTQHLDNLSYYRSNDFMSPIASGSFLTGGMVVCPCSGSTLSSVAHGTSANLTGRSAEVHLKERRPLILVPRETPLSLTAIENMRTATLAGAVVLPAMPAWYHGAQSIDDLVDFVVARILDQLGIVHTLSNRWGE